MKRACNSCGKSYDAQRATSKFCSTSCRVRNSKNQNVVNFPPPVDPSAALVDTPTVKAVRDELEAVDRMDGYLGAAALQLAAMIDGSSGPMGYSALVKELRATMEQALAGVVRVDPLDELRAKRVKRLSG